MYNLAFQVITLCTLQTSTYFKNRQVPTGFVQAPSFLSAEGANPKEMTAPLSSWLSPKEQISSSQ